MKVYIVGEDPVTYAIIKKVLAFCSPKIEIITELPARGGQVKCKISKFNKLSESFPVILLTDLDASLCAPQLLAELLEESKNENFIFNIAVDEAEAWLMADREGFSKYFNIEIGDMPNATLTKQGGRNELVEMNFSYKSSMYLTHELVNKMKKKEHRDQLTPKQGAAKGPEYNPCMLPFINEHWNINQAKVNSDSLNRMILRIENLLNRQKS
ncbi:MAG: DUF4276 family protein [Prevotellaceae bacterium]|jgi:hypothetical protein|nr:DUF4276 family protein [Prevotellaceae bacterium]